MSGGGEEKPGADCRAFGQPISSSLIQNACPMISLTRSFGRTTCIHGKVQMPSSLSVWPLVGPRGRSASREIMFPDKVTARVGVGVCYGPSDESRGTCGMTGVGWPVPTFRCSSLLTFSDFCKSWARHLISHSCNELFNQELLNWLAVIPDLMAEGDNLILIHKHEGLIVLQRSETSGLSPGERTAQAAASDAAV